LAEDKAQGGKNRAAYNSWLEATPTPINNQPVVPHQFCRTTSVGAASCRETVFSFRQRRIRSKDDRFNTPKSGFKILDRAKEQGALRKKSGAYTAVREHFFSERNAAIWCEMNF
jgi:hypothetical protein